MVKAVFYFDRKRWDVRVRFCKQEGWCGAIDQIVFYFILVIVLFKKKTHNSDAILAFVNGCCFQMPEIVLRVHYCVDGKWQLLPQAKTHLKHNCYKRTPVQAGKRVNTYVCRCIYHN